jgi:hypothetical protein
VYSDLKSPILYLVLNSICFFSGKSRSQPCDLIDNNIFFPINLRKGEDTLFKIIFLLSNPIIKHIDNHTLFFTWNNVVNSITRNITADKKINNYIDEIKLSFHLILLSFRFKKISFYIPFYRFYLAFKKLIVLQIFYKTT